MRAMDACIASGSNCTGVVVGKMLGRPFTSSARYDRPNVSPVKKLRLTVSK